MIEPTADWPFALVSFTQTLSEPDWWHAFAPVTETQLTPNGGADRRPDLVWGGFLADLGAKSSPGRDGRLQLP